MNKAEEFRKAVLGYCALLLAHSADGHHDCRSNDRCQDELNVAFSKAAHAGAALVAESQARTN